MNQIYIKTEDGLFAFDETQFNLYVKTRATSECKKYKDLRFGQCVFNITQDICGNIVDEFRGLNKDCFYNDEKLDLFLYSIFNKLISKMTVQ